MGKKTVIYEDIDGYQVVKMFSDATVDAVSTWSKISDKVQALDELAQANSTKKKIVSEQSTANSAYTLALSAQKAGKTTSYNAYLAQYKAAVAQAAVHEETLVSQMAAYQTARNTLFEDNKTYFTPGSGETVLDDDTYTALKAAFDALTEHQKLTLSGDVVADYRGSTYWTKTDGTWSSTTISALAVTVPDGSVLQADLTDSEKTEIEEQTEAARVAALTDDEKETEAEEAAAVAKTAAAALYNEELISGTDAATALSDSQAYYKEQLAVINAKYGTTIGSTTSETSTDSSSSTSSTEESATAEESSTTTESSDSSAES